MLSAKAACWCSSVQQAVLNIFQQIIQQHKREREHMMAVSRHVCVWLHTVVVNIWHRHIKKIQQLIFHFQPWCYRLAVAQFFMKHPCLAVMYHLWPLWVLPQINIFLWRQIGCVFFCFFWHGYHRKWLLRCGFFCSATTTLWYVHQNKVSSTQASEFSPKLLVCSRYELLIHGLFWPRWHGISFRRSPCPPVGSRTCRSPVVGGGNRCTALLTQPPTSSASSTNILPWCSASDLSRPRRSRWSFGFCSPMSHFCACINNSRDVLESHFKAGSTAASFLIKPLRSVTRHLL